jgi:RNA polymerase sigma-70 factor (ECF subfamily)
MQDSDAIARLQQGDISGLEHLVHRYQATALQAAFLTTRDYALAEDIVQAAFVRAYERIGQFDARRPFGPWFLRSVVNDALMAVTRHPHVSLDAQAEAQPEQFAGSGPGPDALLEAAETKEAIWAALERLSPGQRAVVVLRYYGDQSDSEMAAALDCPPGTVRRRLHDARLRLRQLLPAWVRPSANED